MFFVIVLRQHISILIESSSGPSKTQIITYCFLEGPEDDSMRIETRYPSTIIKKKRKKVVLCLTDTSLCIYEVW